MTPYRAPVPRRRATVLSVALIRERIVVVRGMRVMLDRDLAALYGVETKVLNQAVARNARRFPTDFSFRLTRAEMKNLKSQFVTSSSHGGLRKTPRAFTEQGVAMLSSVLKSDRAVDVNVAVMRAFVHLRSLLATHADLIRRLDALERRYDGQFADVFEAIRRLMAPRVAPEPRRRRIGFTALRAP